MAPSSLNILHTNHSMSHEIYAQDDFKVNHKYRGIGEGVGDRGGCQNEADLNK